MRAVSCATLRTDPSATRVTPSDRSIVPSPGNPVTVTVSCDAAKLGSVGATISIIVGALLPATVRDTGVVVGGFVSGPIDKVAVPFVLRPDGSVTVYVNVELVPKAPAVGLNMSPVNWATVRVLPL